MSRPFLSILIINYQTPDLTIQILESIATERQAHRQNLGGSQLEVIVVDNASADDSAIRLTDFCQQTEYQAWVKFLVAPTNGGFAVGNSLALAEASGEVIMLLNSDTIVLPDSLHQLVKMLRAGQDRDRQIGVIGCQLRNHDDQQIQPQGGDLPTLGSIFTQMFFWDDLPWIGRYLPSVQHTGRNYIGAAAQLTAQQAITDHQGFETCGWVGGTALVVRTELIELVGFLDQQIFMYGEDIEFCARVKKMTQLDSAVYHLAPIVHFGSASSGSRRALLGEFAGQIYFWRKLKPGWQLPFLRLILAGGALLRWLIYLVLGKKELRQTYAQALQIAFSA